MAATFPQDIAQQLLGTDYRLLDELSFLARQQRKKSGAAYCMPGRQYLSQKLGVSIRTVSRSIARLTRLGILDATQRRPIRGRWQTNLYKIRSWVGWRMGQISGMLRKLTYRGPCVAHIASSKRNKEQSEPLSPPIPTLKETKNTWWEAKGEGPNPKGEALLADWKKRGIIPN